METWKLRAAMAAFGLFVFSGFYSVNELRHLLWGRKAQAEVVEAKLGRDPGSRRGREVLLATLSYTDADGQARTTTDILHADSEISQGDRVVVQYIPGDEYATRVEGNRNLLPLAIFGGSLLAAGAFVAMLIREANEPYRKKRRPSPPPGSKRR
jgi:hypothetical protein